jgi:NADH dehydrogenase FAD-containing subunit
MSKKEKASARGKRKSIVSQYKAKAKGKPDKKKPVKRKKTIVKKVERQMEMTIGENVYTVGDVAWFVDERSTLVHPRALQGDVTAVYPIDNIEPAVGIREYESGKHRAIRARLIGWSKKEAKEKFLTFKKEDMEQ